MNPHKIQTLILAACLTLIQTARAEEHTDAALQHADQASRSSGDSAAIREHAEQALQHLQAAQAANAGNTGKLQHLRHSETTLNEAISQAQRYNSPSAGAEAEDARKHLEQANKP